MERDQEKWAPVFRPITRPAKDSGAGHETALFPPKAILLWIGGEDFAARRRNS